MEDDQEIYTIFRFKCGPGTVFDETLSVCTWPHLAKPPCLNTDPTTTMSSQTIFDIPINDTYPVTVSTSSTKQSTAGLIVSISQISINQIINTTTQGTTYKPSTESTDTTRLCRSPGFWRNKTDCTKFYRHIILFNLTVVKKSDYRINLYTYYPV